METIAIPKRPVRKFVPESFQVSNWEALKPFFEKLLNQEIKSETELKQWLHDRSELESVVSEDLGWRYIRMTCYTDKEEYSKAYQDFIQNIQPHIAPYSDQMNDQEMTLPQAGVLLQSTDRVKREEVFRKITERRLKDKDALNALYSKLISLRHKVALNAGFKNFRDFQFKAYGRFDYTPKDCFDFHESIANEVVPVLNQFAKERKATMKIAE